MHISAKASYAKPFLSMRLFVLIGSLISVFPVFAQSGSLYADPQQRFTIQVPTGWLAKANGPGGAWGVTLLRGSDTSVQVSVQKILTPPNIYEQ